MIILYHILVFITIIQSTPAVVVLFGTSTCLSDSSKGVTKKLVHDGDGHNPHHFSDAVPVKTKAVCVFTHLVITRRTCHVRLGGDELERLACLFRGRDGEELALRVGEGVAAARRKPQG